LGRPSDRNDKFPGVDFRIEVSEGSWIWLEVKHPTPNPHNEEAIKQANAQERLNLDFLDEYAGRQLLSCFYGSTSFLAWTAQPLPLKELHFVVLWEPLEEFDSAILGRLNEKIEGPFPRKQSKRSWKCDIRASVMTKSDWNEIYSQFPVSPA
jgi:hypothetical protein